MEEPIISTTEEGENEPQLKEDHAHRVSQHPWHSSSRIHPQGPDRQQKVCESLTRLHKITSRPHSSSGRNAVTGVLLRKVTISKEMVFKLE
jgi:hypothetical protein